MYLYERLNLKKELDEKYRQKLQNNALVNEENKMNRQFVALMTSQSHTMGNVLVYIQNYILDLFPKDKNNETMFKTIHVHSKIAHRQLRSTSSEFLKKQRPMIIFRPRLGAQNEERFLQGTPMIERQSDLYHSWGDTNLQPFIDDPRKRLSVKYQLNRSVMYVDVILIFSTLLQQIDYKHYLENAVRWDHPFSANTCLESFLPQDMLKILGEQVGIPLYDSNNNTKDFLSYINAHSLYPVTYKFYSGNGLKEFYRYYPVNVDLLFSDLSSDDGSQNSQITTNYQISFTVRLEFNSTGFYYIFGQNIKHQVFTNIDGERSDLIPVYTDILMKEDLILAHGWVLHDRFGLRLTDIDDTVSFKDFLNTSILSCIAYHKDNGLPLDDLIDIKVRKQGKLARYGEVYNIDWDKFEINFTNQDTYHTFTVLICVNLEYINNLVKTLYNLK